MYESNAEVSILNHHLKGRSEAESGGSVPLESETEISEKEENENSTSVNYTAPVPFVLSASVKKSWSKLEWINWALPGPLFTIMSTIIVGYTCGPSLAVGAFALLVATDIFVFCFSP